MTADDAGALVEHGASLIACDDATATRPREARSSSASSATLSATLACFEREHKELVKTFSAKCEEL
jgi:hypothetical protein